MENGHAKWRFQGSRKLGGQSAMKVTTRAACQEIMSKLNPQDKRPTLLISLALEQTPFAEDAIVESVRSAKFNCYSSIVGIPSARRLSFIPLYVSEHLSKDLPYKLSPDDICIIVGYTQAMEIILTVLNSPVCHYDLLPEKGLLKNDSNSYGSNIVAAIVIINLGILCGSVFSYEHLEKLAGVLGIMLITHEVYDHLAFGSKPFVPIGVFASIVPIVKVRSLSKRWIIPGWRLGWLVLNDPNCFLRKSSICSSPTLSQNDWHSINDDFTRGALPQILKKTGGHFFSKIECLLRETSEMCYDMTKEIPCIDCPHKPKGFMFAMVKLNLGLLEGIETNMDFYLKFSSEESIIALP
ncbi:Aminotransferase, class I/classII, partial [Dillenia turbinata]